MVSGIHSMHEKLFTYISWTLGRILLTSYKTEQFGASACYYVFLLLLLVLREEDFKSFISCFNLFQWLIYKLFQRRGVEDRDPYSS